MSQTSQKLLFLIALVTCAWSWSAPAQAVYNDCRLSVERDAFTDKKNATFLCRGDRFNLAFKCENESSFFFIIQSTSLFPDAVGGGSTTVLVRVGNLSTASIVFRYVGLDMAVLLDTGGNDIRVFAVGASIEKKIAIQYDGITHVWDLANYSDELLEVAQICGYPS